MLTHRVSHVGGGDAELRHTVRTQPDAHGIVRHTEDRRLVGTVDTFDGIQHVDVGIVRYIVRSVTAVGGVERDNQHETLRGLLDDDPLIGNCRGQLGRGPLNAVLHVDLGQLGICALVEVDIEGVVAGRGAGGLHVDHVVSTVDLLLDGCANVLRYGLGVRARVGRCHLDLYRCNVRELGDGQIEHGYRAGDCDHQRDNGCENRAVNEEVSEHGRYLPAQLPAALALAAPGFTILTGTPLERRTRPSVTTCSPLDSPSEINQSAPCQSPTLT